MSRTNPQTQAYPMIQVESERAGLRVVRANVAAIRGGLVRGDRLAAGLARAVTADLGAGLRDVVDVAQVSGAAWNVTALALADGSTMLSLTPFGMFGLSLEEPLAALCHELRTPLAALRAGLGLLDAGHLGPLSLDAREVVGIGLSSTERLVRLVNDVLALRQIHTVEVLPRDGSVDVGRLLQSAVKGLAEHATRTGVPVNVLRCVRGTIRGDEPLLVQALERLIRYRIDASPPGEGVAVYADDGGAGRVRIAVTSATEHDAQVPADELPQIALAVVRRTVELHGGRLGIGRSPGGGTMSWVELPAALRRRTRPMLPALPRDVIAVVDPDPVSSHRTRAVLEDADFAVTVLSSVDRIGDQVAPVAVVVSCADAAHTAGLAVPSVCYGGDALRGRRHGGILRVEVPLPIHEQTLARVLRWMTRPKLRPRVLVAESDVAMRALTVRALRRLAVETIEADGVEEAVLAAEEAEVDLIVAETRLDRDAPTRLLDGLNHTVAVGRPWVLFTSQPDVRPPPRAAPTDVFIKGTTPLERVVRRVDERLAGL